MKILVVAHEADFTGGANRSLMMVIEKLINNYNVEIEVLLPSKKGEFNKKLDEIGVKWYYILPYFGVMSSIRNDGKDILRYGKVYIGYLIEHILSIIASKKMKNNNYDLVYTNTRLPVVGAKIAKRLHIPHVIHVREFGAEKPLWGFWKYEDIYKMSSSVICISNALKDRFSEYVPTDKLVTIHNGIDSPMNLKCDFEKNNKKNFDLILTGRLVPDKGQDDAILAVNKLVKKGYNDIILHIVGSSPKRTHISWYEDKIKKMVVENNLQDNVIFHGEVKDMVTIRENMNVELMCAIRETFGRVTIEGMRSGLAIIGSNTGGTLEIIKDGYNGILYEQGSFDDLADKIELLYNDRKYLAKIACEGYNFSQVNFTPDENVKKIYEVFKKLIDVSKE